MRREVAYRAGKAQAAYLYLPPNADDRSVRTTKLSPGLIVDYAADGRVIGIEITPPRHVRLEAVNAALTAAGMEPASAGELAPLA